MDIPQPTKNVKSILKLDANLFTRKKANMPVGPYQPDLKKR